MSTRPPCAIREIPTLILENYDLNVEVVTEFDSYDDRNILVKLEQDKPLPKYFDFPKNTKFVAKIFNETDSACPEIIKTKNAMMLYLKKSGFPTSAPLINVYGNYQHKIAINPDAQVKFILILLEFAPGITLDKICLTKDLCRNMGEIAGRMDSILKDFPVNEHKGIGQMVNKWNMTEIPYLRTQLHFVQDQEKLPLMKDVLTSFETRILNNQDYFQKGLIHSDLNDCNVIVSPKSKQDTFPSISKIESNANPDYEITGVIDYGDATYSLYILELAICMTYIMINKDNLEPMQAAAALLEGYSQHITLTTFELSHLRLAVSTRMTQSFVFGEVKKVIDGGNDYSQLHSQRIWPILEMLWSLTDDEFLNKITL